MTVLTPGEGPAAANSGAVPVAMPTASSKPRQRATSERPTAAIDATTDTTAPAVVQPAVQASGRVGSRQLAAIRRLLSARDLVVLQHVDQHRYLTTRQVEGFC